VSSAVQIGAILGDEAPVFCELLLVTCHQISCHATELPSVLLKNN